MCPQKSGKEHCSWDEALNPDVSSAVLASCSRAFMRRCMFMKKVIPLLKGKNKLNGALTWLLCWALN